MGASWRQVHPVGSNRGPVPPEVPKGIAADYVEACQVLPLSAKASAALSRRCLQGMLNDKGYKGSNLAKQIDQLLKPGVLPKHIHETVDVIRNFGNFSAHPINDKTSLQIIDVDPEEAEWCLEILEALFDHFYVGRLPPLQGKRHWTPSLRVRESRHRNNDWLVAPGLWRSRATVSVADERNG
jgi:uncharacterized protein DUF4145